MNRKTSALYLRSFVFGVEDSLVSTVGLLSGVAIGDAPRNIIILTGVVLIFVEAFSMASGSFLSESEAEEFDGNGHKKSSRNSFISGGVMFVSYFISGFIPLTPYLVMPVDIAFRYSITFSLTALFILGIISGKFVHSSIWKSALRTLFVGGLAILVGILVGSWL